MKQFYRLSCPNCGDYFNWLDRYSFTGLSLSRKVVPCPSCGTKLTYASAPFRYSNAFGVIFFILSVMRMEFMDRIPIETHTFLRIFWLLSLSGLLISWFRMRIVLADT